MEVAQRTNRIAVIGRGLFTAFMTPLAAVAAFFASIEAEQEALRKAGICTICGVAPAVQNDEQCLDCVLHDQAGA